MKDYRILFWHRKDLRINENQALTKSLSLSRAITSVYVFDKNNQSDFNAQSRAWFLANSLSELSQNWKNNGSRLIFEEGDPILLIPRLANLIKSHYVAWNKSIEPYELERDYQVKKKLEELNIKVIEAWDNLLFNPSEIYTGNNKPYSVYGPFYKKFTKKITDINFHESTFSKKKVKLLLKDLDEKSKQNKTIKLSNYKFENFSKDISFEGENLCPCKPGEQAADNMLNQFIASKKIINYYESRDIPSKIGTSYLSASIRFGTISIKKIWRRTLDLNYKAKNKTDLISIRTWQKELVWREFYQHCLYHFPQLEKGPYRKKWDLFPWQNNQEWYKRWSEGETGIPIIDASMRQLRISGWMHNRCRMIVASFLVKDLICNWQLGEKKFMELLVDGDLAANNGGWQWSASSGMDPKPLRIFNPHTQTQKFDPLCKYIKNWVPELSKVSNSDIIKGDIPKAERNNYPSPLINHNIQQQLFKSLYREI